MIKKRIASALAALMLASSMIASLPAYAEPISPADTPAAEVPSEDTASESDIELIDDEPELVDISAAEILPIADAEYTGRAITPDIVVVLNGISLAKDTDYTVDYSNNINAGRATVTVTGIGGYTGTVTAYFNIVKTEISSVEGFRSASNTTSGYTLKWNSVKGASGYELYKSTSGGSWSKVTTTSSLSYKASGLSAAQKATYRIRAYGSNANGATVYSEYTTLYTATLPKTVTGLNMSDADTTGYTLKWTKVSGADGYNVYLYDASTKKFNLYKSVTTNSVKVTGRKSGQKNTFRVAAVVKAGDNEYEGSPQKLRFTSKPDQVKNFNFKVNGKGYITFSWSKVENANKYQLYYATEKDGKYRLFKEVSKTKTSVKTGLMPTGKKLYFKMRAVSKVDDCVQNGKCSSKIKGMAFNKKSINSILNSYSNSRTVKQINPQGYKLSAGNQSRLLSSLTSLGGDAGYILYDIDSGSAVAYNANTYFGTASTVKMPYVLYCLREMEDGKPSLDTVLTYLPSDYNGGSSWIKYQPFYTKYTIKRVIELIGQYSDNCGYYMMQDYFGYDGYNKFIKSLGCRTSVSRSVRWGYVSACDSAREWNNMWDYLRNGRHRAFARKVFSTTCAANIRSQLGNRYTVYEKSGWTDSLYNETALVRAEHPYIVICLSNRTSAQRMRNVAEISESIHNEMWNYYNKLYR